MKHLVLVLALLGIAVPSLIVSPPAHAAEAKVHKIVLHVDENNARRMNLALNNAQNVRAYYKKKGEKVMIEIVTYGPGLHMLREDTSPVKTRIAAMSMAMPELRFSACGNTLRKMTKKAGKKIQLLDEAKLVPSGVVRLVELQEQGWTYIRP
jgi:intracellular sulfur oxidation DsrE/DsrF family protein